ncbi:MAG TPA: hypothetical protein VJ975_08240 [Candidatus Limnocylindria bacterium]|nr:hypothetical protein [Candidatus Limnocylindria bacterium]
MNAVPVPTVVQHGPKDKKVAAFALDWPGWSRGAKAAPAAVELLEAYRDRYRPVARLAGLEAEFDAAGPLEVVEDHVGKGSTDFWGISFAPSSFEIAPMPEAEIERRLALLRAAWRYFDEVAARVSPELARGPRGGGRSRDEIIRHALGWERVDLAKRVGVVVDPIIPDTPQGLGSHREEYIAALRAYNAEGKVPSGQNWTVALLLRHSAFHVLDHAWEMEDRDLS